MGLPQISDERLEEMMARMKPVVRFSGLDLGIAKMMEPDDRGELYYIKDVDPRAVAYTWDPKPKGKAKGLELLAEIDTRHGYGYYGFFKPSIAEVLAEIPEQYADDCVAFETLVDTVEITGSYHTATTRLYKRGD